LVICGVLAASSSSALTIFDDLGYRPVSGPASLDGIQLAVHTCARRWPATRLRSASRAERLTSIIAADPRHSTNVPAQADNRRARFLRLGKSGFFK